MIKIRIYAVAFFACAAAAGTQILAADGPEGDKVRTEQRLASVGSLLEKSSAARQIEASGDAAARQKHDQAREIYSRAREAFRAGDSALASRLLQEASAKMFEAVRHAAPEQVTVPKAREDFTARLASVNSLRAAYGRVAAEKPAAAGVADTSRNIDSLVREAERQADDGKFDAGRATLDRAYLITKAALSSLRGGDTLVRTLHFATREEEYHYETDRNDTHQMLVKVLLEGKPRGARQQSFLDRARELRAQADAAARGADHAVAVRLMEDSTRELIRAIRSAGVFIPG